MTSRTLIPVLASTSPLLFRTRDTVVLLTLARRATSAIVTRTASGYASAGDRQHDLAADLARFAQPVRRRGVLVREHPLHLDPQPPRVHERREALESGVVGFDQHGRDPHARRVRGRPRP